MARAVDPLGGQVRDQYGNLAPDDGALTTEIVGPDRVSHTLEMQTVVENGMPTLMAKHEPLLMGMYWMDVLLNGTPVQGSPITFRCVAGSADGQKSYVVLPDGPFYEDMPYELVLQGVDRLGNKCTRGGALVTARLTSANTSSPLPAEQDPIIEVDDMEDGTYVMDIELVAEADVKLNVTIQVTATREEPHESAMLPPTLAPATEPMQSLKEPRPAPSTRPKQRADDDARWLWNADSGR